MGNRRGRGCKAKGGVSRRDGHLYEVKLNKGKSGLGLSIVANTNTQSVKGIVIMGIQTGGVADQSGRIEVGGHDSEGE